MAQIQQFGIGAKYSLTILCHSGKSVKTKTQKDLGLIPTFLAPILNRVNSMNHVVNNMNFLEQILTQPAITCSNLTKETLEQGLKYVQS